MIEKDDRRITIRKPAAGQAGRIFQAAGFIAAEQAQTGYLNNFLPSQKCSGDNRLHRHDSLLSNSMSVGTVQVEARSRQAVPSH